ncbi:MAG: hypothetical protein ABIO81_03810 [Ginsengibacter sp.]
MKLNKVQLERLSRHTILDVSIYHIDDYKSFPKPYEKHYKNYKVSVTEYEEKLKFLKGDYIAKLNQPSNRYIIETLEPTGDDGFFA